jgi:hypothetical protein
MTYAPKFRPDPLLDLVPRISSVTTLTTLKAIPINDRDHGATKHVEADNSQWYFHSTSAVTGDDLLVATPASGTGRWLRMPGTANIVLPFTFATADAAVMLTVPAGCLLLLRKFYWTIAADMTGGASSAIGVSSSKTGFTTKGDLLGGATGDVAAALTAALSPANGTIGAKMDTVAELHTTLWKAADIIRFDRITSAFTAGSGAVNVVADILTNAGA